MSLEKKLETKCRLHVEKRGGKLLKFVSPGNKGVPDRILLMPGGYAVYLEFKRPGGRKQPLQGWWIKWLNDNGHKAYVIDNFKDFVGIVK